MVDENNAALKRRAEFQRPGNVQADRFTDGLTQRLGPRSPGDVRRDRGEDIPPVEGFAYRVPPELPVCQGIRRAAGWKRRREWIEEAGLVSFRGIRRRVCSCLLLQHEGNQPVVWNKKPAGWCNHKKSPARRSNPGIDDADVDGTRREVGGCAGYDEGAVGYVLGWDLVGDINNGNLGAYTQHHTLHRARVPTIRAKVRSQRDDGVQHQSRVDTCRSGIVVGLFKNA